MGDGADPEGPAHDAAPPTVDAASHGSAADGDAGSGGSAPWVADLPPSAWASAPRYAVKVVAGGSLPWNRAGRTGRPWVPPLLGAVVGLAIGAAAAGLAWLAAEALFTSM